MLKQSLVVGREASRLTDAASGDWDPGQAAWAWPCASASLVCQPLYLWRLPPGTSGHPSASSGAGQRWLGL